MVELRPRKKREVQMSKLKQIEAIQKRRWRSEAGELLRSVARRLIAAQWNWRLAHLTARRPRSSEARATVLKIGSGTAERRGAASGVAVR